MAKIDTYFDAMELAIDDVVDDFESASWMPLAPMRKSKKPETFESLAFSETDNASSQNPYEAYGSFSPEGESMAQYALSIAESEAEQVELLREFLRLPPAE